MCGEIYDEAQEKAFLKSLYENLSIYVINIFLMRCIMEKQVTDSDARKFNCLIVFLAAAALILTY